MATLVDETVIRLKSITKKRKLSYEQLSVMSGVPLPTIRNIFSGKTKYPRISTLSALQKVLEPTDDCYAFILNISDNIKLTETDVHNIIMLYEQWKKSQNS